MKTRKRKPAKKRALAPKGGNERVYTPPALAAQIVTNFRAARSRAFVALENDKDSQATSAG